MLSPFALEDDELECNWEADWTTRGPNLLESASSTCGVAVSARGAESSEGRGYEVESSVVLVLAEREVDA